MCFHVYVLYTSSITTVYFTYAHSKYLQYYYCIRVAQTMALPACKPASWPLIPSSIIINMGASHRPPPLNTRNYRPVVHPLQ